MNCHFNLKVLSEPLPYTNNECRLVVTRVGLVGSNCLMHTGTLKKKLLEVIRSGYTALINACELSLKMVKTVF